MDGDRYGVTGTYMECYRYRTPNPDAPTIGDRIASAKRFALTYRAVCDGYGNRVSAIFIHPIRDADPATGGG